ncbi:glycosyltransferase family 2 protein [Jiella sp. M17.18]|uniref:glycosyltransferase family 2 protein n=1 Tax=Jiella sp. M17.18 TaxID=3234247 RepID=UPI0034DF6059
MTPPRRIQLGVVIPAFNEESNIAAVVEATRRELDALGVDWTITFVDDGSRDHTREVIRQWNARDGRIRAVFLSRNFGKELAIAAGLRKATGDAIVVMDADLQHPPAAIRRFFEAWQGGAEVVLGHRADEMHAGFLRQLASRTFYPVFRLLSQMPLRAGTVDFVLLDRKAVDAVNRFNERTRFTKGLFRWIGFRTETVTFVADARTAGVSSFNFRRLLHFAVDGIVAFSSFPLRMWSGIGVLISSGSMLYAIYFLVRTLVHGNDVPGFPSLIVSITFLSGIQLLSLGVIGEYLSRIYEEVKARPLFLVSEELGDLEEAAAAGDSAAGTAPESSRAAEPAKSGSVSHAA